MDLTSKNVEKMETATLRMYTQINKWSCVMGNVEIDKQLQKVYKSLDSAYIQLRALEILLEP